MDSCFSLIGAHQHGIAVGQWTGKTRVSKTLTRMRKVMAIPRAANFSPAKNVWLVDARPRDIVKFKMAAIPPSFVYSSGKKINCRLIWVANAYTDFLRIAQTFYYPFSPIPMGFVPCDARVLAGLPDSTLDSSRSRRTTIFLMKAGSLERTAFVHSSMQRRNKTLWVLWNCLDTWKLFYYFFSPKR